MVITTTTLTPYIKNFINSISIPKIRIPMNKHILAMRIGTIEFFVNKMLEDSAIQKSCIKVVKSTIEDMRFMDSNTSSFEKNEILIRICGNTEMLLECKGFISDIKLLV